MAFCNNATQNCKQSALRGEAGRVGLAAEGTLFHLGLDCRKTLRNYRKKGFSRSLKQQCSAVLPQTRRTQRELRQHSPTMSPKFVRFVSHLRPQTTFGGESRLSAARCQTVAATEVKRNKQKNKWCDATQCIQSSRRSGGRTGAGGAFDHKEL